MKISLIEATKGLRCHPCELILWTAAIPGMAGTFEDVYPEIDEAVVETVRAMHRDRFSGSHTHDPVKSRADTGVLESSHPSDAPHVSQPALRILRTLYQKNHWGTHGAPDIVVKKSLGPQYADCFAPALRELKRLALLKECGPKGPFSLNPKTKRQIEDFIRSVPSEPDTK